MRCGELLLEAKSYGATALHYTAPHRAIRQNRTEKTGFSFFERTSPAATMRPSCLIYLPASVGLARAHPQTKAQAVEPSRQTWSSYGPSYPLGRWHVVLVYSYKRQTLTRVPNVPMNISEPSGTPLRRAITSEPCADRDI